MRSAAVVSSGRATPNAASSLPRRSTQNDSRTSRNFFRKFLDSLRTSITRQPPQKHKSREDDADVFKDSSSRSEATTNSRTPARSPSRFKDDPKTGDHDSFATSGLQEHDAFTSTPPTPYSQVANNLSGSKYGGRPHHNILESDTPKYSPRHSTEPGAQLKASRTRNVRFSWRVARALVKLRMQPAETFSVNGVPWASWELTKIPTLGASPTSCRVQEMFKATLPSTGMHQQMRVFIKSVPIRVWRKQWDMENKWDGEFVTDGENFVMEAAALAFLQEYGPGLAPRLLGVLELSGPINANSQRVKKSAARPHLNAPLPTDVQCEVTHVVIVSELYGEDLLDFLDRREREKRPLQPEEKRRMQYDCVVLGKRLHSLGLAHLDYTPENLLCGPRGFRLCDFAKATPLQTSNFRHIHGPLSRTGGLQNASGAKRFPFESCEPTVGKGAYMPPECWKVYWKLEDTRVQFPLDELWHLATPEDRAAYYFSVTEADVYMMGVVLFWIWSDGGVWRCSDTRQDEKYEHLVHSGLNFGLFRECRSWPLSLKEMLQQALCPEVKNRLSLDGLLNHQWFDGLRPKQQSSHESQSSRVGPPPVAAFVEAQ